MPLEQMWCSTCGLFVAQPPGQRVGDQNDSRQASSALACARLRLLVACELLGWFQQLWGSSTAPLILTALAATPVVLEEVDDPWPYARGLETPSVLAKSEQELTQMCAEILATCEDWAQSSRGGGVLCVGRGDEGTKA